MPPDGELDDRPDVAVTIAMMSIWQLVYMLNRFLRQRFEAEYLAAELTRPEPPPTPLVQLVDRRRRNAPPSAALPVAAAVATGTAAARISDVVRVIEMQQMRGGEVRGAAPSLAALSDLLLDYLDVDARAAYVAELKRVRADSTESQRLAFRRRWVQIVRCAVTTQLTRDEGCEQAYENALTLY